LIHYTKVIYNKCINYIFDDAYRGWIKSSLTSLPDIIKKNKIELILSSYAPTAPHIVALKLYEG